MEESNVQNPRVPSTTSTFIWIYSFTLTIFDYASYVYHAIISRLLALIGLEKSRYLSIRENSRQGDSAILVTGSSSGIGQFLALDWFSKGYTIFATVRKAEDGQNLEDIASDISQESGRVTGRLIPIVIDFADPFSLDNGLRDIQEHINRLGLNLVAVINNAAESMMMPVESMSEAEMERMIQTNLLSPINLTRRLLPQLKQTRGRIINIGSPNGWIPSPGFSAYSLTKAALRAWTLTLCAEARLSGISVSLIEPGCIRTNAQFKILRSLDSFMNVSTQDEKSRQRYIPTIKYYQQVMSKQFRLGIHPVHVGRAVSHALTTLYPKRIYYVGWDARTLAAASWLLGDENISRIMETMTMMKE